MLPFLVRKNFPRPPADLVARLADVDTTVLADLVGRLYTMSHDIRPLYVPSPPLLGVVSMVRCPPGDNLGVMQALRLVEPGDVLVIDGMGFTEWCLGGFQILEFARRERGLAGVVVNGAYRDVREAQAAGFPLYGKAVAPYSGPKMGPAEVNVAVCCGGVIVHPGDIVTASEDGVVVAPQMSLSAVVDAVSKAATRAAERRGGNSHIAEFLDEMDEHVAAIFAAGRGKLLP